MSAVVLEELYAGALDIHSVKLLDKMYDTFSRMSRLITPDAVDWQKTGKVVAQLGNKYGFESLYLSRLTNDVLIAATARKIGAVVATYNKKDFSEYKNISILKFIEGMTVTPASHS